MKKTIEIEVVYVFVAVFENRSTYMGCYYPEDDWKRKFINEDLEELKKEISKFRAAHDGSIDDAYKTRQIRFEYEGHKYSELVPERIAIDKSKLVIPDILGSERKRLREEKERKEELDRIEGKKRREREEHELYLKLKGKYEGM